jgi:hypothetical protein
MSDLLKEAIADAKAVRETALQNAKMALQEAFTPQLKSMLSAKLREEEPFEDEDEVDEFGHDDEVDEFGHDDEAEEEGAHEGEHEEGYHEDDEVPGEEFPGEEEPDMEEEGVIEINGVKYAPVVSEEDEMFEASTRPGEQPEPDGYGPEVNEEQELDLESVIKELESELDEGEHEDEDKEKDLDESDNPYDTDEQHNEYTSVKNESVVEEEFEIDESLFNEEENDDEDKEDKVDEEVDQSSGIGSGTGRGNTDRSSGIGAANKKLKAENKEYKEAVKFLKDKLHEVNILNAKLLFTNKLFKEFALSNDQKMNVVENFDRAHTTREIKLVYATLCEGFGQNKGIRKKSINEVASAKAGSTRPSKKVITESDAIAERFKKLANIR